jgi:hypothetical protein
MYLDLEPVVDLPWQKNRHSSFPTVDFPCHQLPDELGSTLARFLENRILPHISSVTGIDMNELSLLDIFFVRYRPIEQAGLAFHTDGCLVSFNIPINDDFDGGGTAFQGSYLTDDSTVQFLHGVTIVRPRAGDMLVHDAKLLHSGVAVTRADRYLLVGFVETAAVARQKHFMIRQSREKSVY